MSAASVLQRGTTSEIVYTLGAQRALLTLEQSISTLERHRKALDAARTQLIVKRNSIQEFVKPLEAEQEIEL